jgi:hypothetical protein
MGCQPTSPADAAKSDLLVQSFFDRMTGKYQNNAVRFGEAIHHSRIAGREVRVRIGDKSLEHLARPLAHLHAEFSSARAASLEIMVFAGSDGWLPPQPPWDFLRLKNSGGMADWNSENFFVNFNADYFLLQMFHRPSGRGMFWIRDPQRLPFWETAAPFRMLLHWWAQGFGGQVCHAAAIGKHGQGMLLIGAGGSGKSSTSIACLNAGMEYVGDDYVLLTCDPVPKAHSLYHSAKIHTPFLRQAFPQWRGRAAAQIGPQNKSLLFINECLPRQIRSSLEIRANFQPKIDPANQASYRPLSNAQALLAIIPSTLNQLPDAHRETFSFLSRWVQAVPCYALPLGRDLASAPNRLLQYLIEKEARRAA